MAKNEKNEASANAVKKFNRAALMEDANAIDVARAIGMNVTKRGSKYFIPCPGHIKRLGKADTHATNAVLTPKGYRCYACHATVGVIDMVMEYLECDSKTAMTEIADICGGAEAYKHLTDGRREARMPISQEDMRIIGLAEITGASTKRLINASDVEPKVLGERQYFQQEGDLYFIYEKVEGWNLQRLFRENEKKFNDVIAYQARAAMYRYKQALDRFCSRNAEQATDVYELFCAEEGGIDKSVFIELKNEYQRKYWRSKEIMEEYLTKNGRKASE